MSRTSKRLPPRQWLRDRVHGVTLEGEDRPPSFLCFPPPLLKCFPFLLETNCLCICLGRIGCCAENDNWARGAVLKVGACMNVLGFLFATFSALALSNTYSRLENGFEFARGTLTPINQPSDSALDPSFIYLGLRATAFNNPNTFGQAVVPFQNFCDMANGGGMEKYIEPEKCSQCYDVSFQLIITILIAVVSFIPTFAIDILRVYSNFDVNCQKALSSLLSGVTLACFILTYSEFNKKCLDIFFDELVSYSSTGNVAEPGSLDEAVVVDFKWKIGNGAICLFVAFGLKLIQFLCNCCIPTPAITRNLDEQEEYEKLAEESGDEDSVSSDVVDIWR